MITDRSTLLNITQKVRSYILPPFRRGWCVLECQVAAEVVHERYGSRSSGRTCQDEQSSSSEHNNAAVQRHAGAAPCGAPPWRTRWTPSL